MDLDELQSLLQTLRERINSHQTVLSQSEAQTRYSLIDPFLRKLGWDIEDPAQICPEYKLEHSNQVVDYALFVPGDQSKPRLVIEAKKLNRELKSAAAQASNYCVIDAVTYFAVTDGNNWAFYDTFKPVPLNQKVISTFKISDTSQNTAMRSLWLWRGNFASMCSPELPVLPVNGEDPPPPPTDGISISEVDPKKHKLPATLLLPANQSREIKSWRELFVQIFSWLVDAQKITSDMCPIRHPNRSSYLVNNKNQDHNNQPFFVDYEHKGFWINKHGNAAELLKRVTILLQEAGIELGSVRLKSTG